LRIVGNEKGIRDRRKQNAVARQPKHSPPPECRQ
jgi:hypothetical protein